MLRKRNPLNIFQQKVSIIFNLQDHYQVDKNLLDQIAYLLRVDIVWRYIGNKETSEEEQTVWPSEGTLLKFRPISLYHLETQVIIYSWFIPF